MGNDVSRHPNSGVPPWNTSGGSRVAGGRNPPVSAIRLLTNSAITRTVTGSNTVVAADLATAPSFSSRAAVSLGFSDAADGVVSTAVATASSNAPVAEFSFAGTTVDMYQWQWWHRLPHIDAKIVSRHPLRPWRRAPPTAHRHESHSSTDFKHGDCSLPVPKEAALILRSSQTGDNSCADAVQLPMNVLNAPTHVHVDPVLSYSHGSYLGRSTRVKCLEISGDGMLIAIAGSDEKKLALFDMSTGMQVSTIDGHTDTLTACCFSADGKSLLTAARDCLSILWDASCAKQVRALEHESTVMCCCFSPDGRQVLLGRQADKCAIFDHRRLELLVTFAEHNAPVLSVAWSPDGLHCCSASADRKAMLWDSKTGIIKHQLEHSNYVLHCSFTTESRRVITHDDKSVFVWDVRTGAVVKTIHNEPEKMPPKKCLPLVSSNQPAFNANENDMVQPRFLTARTGPGGYILTATTARTLKVVHPGTLDEVLVLNMRAAVYSIAIYKDVIVCGDAAGNVSYVTLHLQSSLFRSPNVNRRMDNHEEEDFSTLSLSSLLAHLPTQ